MTKRDIKNATLDTLQSRLVSIKAQINDPKVKFDLRTNLSLLKESKRIYSELKHRGVI